MNIGQGSARRLPSAEALSVDRMAHGLRMQLELSRDGADLPVLGIIEAANFGNLFRGDHCSLQVIKRIDKHPRASAATADDPRSVEKEIALWRPRLDQTGVKSDEFGIIAWGGADNVIRGLIIGTMIRHTFYGRGSGRSGQAPAVSALTIAMIEAAVL